MIKASNNTYMILIMIHMKMMKIMNMMNMMNMMEMNKDMDMIKNMDMKGIDEMDIPLFKMII